MPRPSSTSRSRPGATARSANARPLVLDARYEKVRHGGDCAVLVAVGVRADGKRTVLGTSVSLSEAEIHWREFLETSRIGACGVRRITSDDHAGMKAALAARFPGTPWQGCQFRLQQNAQAYVPRQELKQPVARELRAIFNATDRRDAAVRLARVGLPVGA